MDANPAPAEPEAYTVETAIRGLVPKLPRPVSLRARNALDHLDKALILFPTDQAMASFRAITGEEEAAAALFKALQRQGYPNADKLSVRDHSHKAGAIACLIAIRSSIGSIVNNVVLDIDPDAVTIEVQIPVGELGVKQSPGDDLYITPKPPLDILRVLGDGRRDDVFAPALARVAKASKSDSIKTLVKARANDRNRLLYASNKSLPRSRVTEEGILRRKQHALALIGIAVITLQTKKHQAMLSQAIESLLAISKELPSDAVT